MYGAYGYGGYRGEPVALPSIPPDIGAELVRVRRAIQNVKSRIENLEVKIHKKQTRLQECVTGVRTHCPESLLTNWNYYIENKTKELNEAIAELIELEAQGEYREAILKGKPTLIFFTHAYTSYLTPPPPMVVAPPVVVAPPPPVAEPVHQATQTVPREPEGPQYTIDLQDIEGGIAHHTQNLQRTDLTPSQRAMSESTLGGLKARKDLFVGDPSLFLVPDPAMMETDAGMATIMLRGLHLEVRILDLALAKGYFSPQSYQTAIKGLNEVVQQMAEGPIPPGFPPALLAEINAFKAEVAAKAMGKVTKDRNGTITISKKKPNYLLWGLGALVLFRVMR